VLKQGLEEYNSQAPAEQQQQTKQQVKSHAACWGVLKQPGT
jgi:hypothetical protein